MLCLGRNWLNYYRIPFALTLFADGNPIIGINNKSLVSRYRQLEAKFRKLEESVVCCICVERKKDVIFRCGHGACQLCTKQLSVCHICQKPIDIKIQLFLLRVVPRRLFFFFFKHKLHYLSIRHESSFGEQPLLSEISLFPCSAMFKIYIKSQRNKNKSDSYCERLQKKSSQVRPYINIPQYLKFFRARRNM